MNLGSIAQVYTHTHTHNLHPRGLELISCVQSCMRLSPTIHTRTKTSYTNDTVFTRIIASNPTKGLADYTIKMRVYLGNGHGHALKPVVGHHQFFDFIVSPDFYDLAT